MVLCALSACYYYYWKARLCSETKYPAGEQKIFSMKVLTWKQVRSRQASATRSPPPCRSGPSRSNPSQESASSATSAVTRGQKKQRVSDLRGDDLTRYRASDSQILWLALGIKNEITCSSMSLMITKAAEFDSHCAFASSKLYRSLEKK